MSVHVRQLSYTLGAEISGVSLREPLEDKDFREIHAAFLKYGVLLFRGQPLTREHQIAFSKRFGELDNTAAPRLRPPECPEIVVVKSTELDKSGDKFGGYWHTDHAHTSVPPMATLLRSVEIPEVGGDTMFANMYQAYETLSDGMKTLISDLHGIHIGGKYEVDKNPPIAQPLVRVHPETGRKALYLTDKVKQLVGMTSEESRPLLQYLLQHATRPQFLYRHQWRKDDLLMWDNRCLMHNALGDFDHSQVRHMERTSVHGTPSGHAYDGPRH